MTFIQLIHYKFIKIIYIIKGILTYVNININNKKYKLSMVFSFAIFLLVIIMGTVLIDFVSSLHAH